MEKRTPGWPTTKGGGTRAGPGGTKQRKGGCENKEEQNRQVIPCSGENKRGVRPGYRNIFTIGEKKTRLPDGRINGGNTPGLWRTERGQRTRRGKCQNNRG